METLVDDLQAATGRLEDARTDTMVLLAAAAEAHEQSTGAHLHRVQELSEHLARALGYDDASAEAVGQAAILHDIGKVRVPERILQSPARLDGTEWAIMKQHTTWGAEFLAQRPGFEMAAVVAACHHERWDGTGYPRGLSETQIPEVAQIVTVADSFDAITSDRPYRGAHSAAWAVEEITRCAGTQFSPRVVEALRGLYERGDLGLGDAERPQAA
jgi:putative two-component system response regulator